MSEPIPPAPSQALRSICNVSRETESALVAYVDRLCHWNRRVNLVGRATVAEVWTRHVLDSAQLLPLAPPTASTWLDIGSGAGLPGLVCAILARGHDWPTRFTLVESDRRKASFLSAISRELDLGVSVLAERVDAIPPQNADIVTARALAPLPRLFEMALPHIHAGSILIFPKGARAREEIVTAATSWRFKLETRPSITSDMSLILRCHEVARA